MREIKRRSDGRLSLDDCDDNWARLNHFSGGWVAGTYDPWELVQHHGGIWLSSTTTSAEPEGSAVDWVLVGADPGIGGMRLAVQSGDLIIPSGDNWLPLPYDTVDSLTLGCAFNPVPGDWLFTWRGTWLHTVQFTLIHGEQNRSRNFFARLFDVTRGLEVTRVRYGIARNQDTTNVALSFRAGITDAVIGETFRIECGDASESITAQFSGTSLDVFQEHQRINDPIA